MAQLVPPPHALDNNCIPTEANHPTAIRFGVPLSSLDLIADTHPPDIYNCYEFHHTLDVTSCLTKFVPARYQSGVAKGSGLQLATLIKLDEDQKKIEQARQKVIEDAAARDGITIDMINAGYVSTNAGYATRESWNAYRREMHESKCDEERQQSERVYLAIMNEERIKNEHRQRLLEQQNPRPQPRNVDDAYVDGDDVPAHQPEPQQPVQPAAQQRQVARNDDNGVDLTGISQEQIAEARAILGEDTPLREIVAQIVEMRALQRN